MSADHIWNSGQGGCVLAVRVAIVEDEAAAARLLKECLDRYAKESGVLMELQFYQNADMFLQVDSTEFDMVFMDIDMPGHNGIEASHILRETNPNIVLLFVTNLAQYALAGYEVNAIDYVLKPVNYYSLKLKIKKALNAVQCQNGCMLTVCGDHYTACVRADDVLYIEVQGHSLIYHTQHGDMNATGTLKDLEAQLTSEGFFRCNYYYLVNMRHVAYCDGDNVTVGTYQLAISRRRRKEFMQALMGFYGSRGR